MPTDPDWTIPTGLIITTIFVLGGIVLLFCVLISYTNYWVLYQEAYWANYTASLPEGESADFPEH